MSSGRCIPGIIACSSVVNPLATVAVDFYDAEKPEEEQPAWASPS